MTELAGWQDRWRRDGLVVQLGLDGWIVLPGDDRPAIDKCPCCNSPLESQRGAQVVADTFYPLPEQGGI